MNFEIAAMYGLYGFVISAVFIAAWAVAVTVAGLIARLLGYKPEGEDE